MQGTTSTTVRTRHSAEFDYPGAFFPESISKAVDDDTLEAVLAAAPTETEGTYFVKDGWYAVTVSWVTEKRYAADDGEVAWVQQARGRSWRAIVGELVHVDTIPADEQHEILRSNIKVSSREPLLDFGVKTRAGNWQIASDYDRVLSTAEVTR